MATVLAAIGVVLARVCAADSDLSTSSKREELYVGSMSALSRHRRYSKRPPRREAVILSTGTPLPAQWTCRRRCRRADVLHARVCAADSEAAQLARLFGLAGEADDALAQGQQISGVGHNSIRRPSLCAGRNCTWGVTTRRA